MQAEPGRLYPSEYIPASQVVKAAAHGAVIISGCSCCQGIWYTGPQIVTAADVSPPGTCSGVSFPKAHHRYRSGTQLGSLRPMHTHVFRLNLKSHDLGLTRILALVTSPNELENVDMQSRICRSSFGESVVSTTELSTRAEPAGEGCQYCSGASPHDPPFHESDQELILK